MTVSDHIVSRSHYTIVAHECALRYAYDLGLLCAILKMLLGSRKEGWNRVAGICSYQTDQRYWWHNQPGQGAESQQSHSQFKRRLGLDSQWNGREKYMIIWYLKVNAIVCQCKFSSVVGTTFVCFYSVQLTTLSIYFRGSLMDKQVLYVSFTPHTIHFEGQSTVTSRLIKIHVCCVWFILIYLFCSHFLQDVKIGHLKVATQYSVSVGAYGWAGEGRPSMPRDVSTVSHGTHAKTL